MNSTQIPRNELWWISLGYATYGIEASDSIVTTAAPIAQWMVGRPLDYCLSWARRKGGKVLLIQRTNGPLNVFPVPEPPSVQP